MPEHHATLGRTLPFPLKIEEFRAQKAFYFLLGTHCFGNIKNFALVFQNKYMY
jgi:hypothetical protein